MIYIGPWAGVIVSPMVVIAGLLAAVTGGWTWSEARDLAAHGQLAHATVTASHPTTFDGEPATSVVLHFEVGGEVIERERIVAPSLYDDDGTIDLVYLPEDPHRFMISGTRIESGSVNLQIGGGIGAALLGVVTFFVALRRARS